LGKTWMILGKPREDFDQAIAELNLLSRNSALARNR
jgi:hypothetical protein